MEQGSWGHGISISKGIEDVEIPGVIKKKSCGISMGLSFVFGFGISKGFSTILCNFQGKALFSLEFPRVKKWQKIPEFFFKKVPLANEQGLF